MGKSVFHKKTKNDTAYLSKITKTEFERVRNGENGIIFCICAKFVDKNIGSDYTEPVKERVLQK